MASGRYRTHRLCRRDPAKSLSFALSRPRRRPIPKEQKTRDDAARPEVGEGMSERRSTGNRVFAAREAKGLSLRRAARRLGVSPRTLRGWERGREDIPYLVRQAMVRL